LHVHYSGMNDLVGIIVKGINNIYTVHSEVGHYLCRIKGKKLPGSEAVYNPLAPGDRVIFSPAAHRTGMISSLIPRENSFVRWNMKRDLPQIMAANFDAVLCTASPDNPPFRPRFIDRVIVCADTVPVIVVLNKADLPISDETSARMNHYQHLGYTVFLTTMYKKETIDTLRNYLSGKTIAVVGQSGVGKSTLINALMPEAAQRTADISEKNNRGKHITNFAVLLKSEHLTIIDTPGIREIQVPVLDLHLIGSRFPEIAQLQDTCSFQPCLHRGEPGCAVAAAVENGSILTDRYESYLRILESIEELKRDTY
jgi:ribosome biogenesis GTPase / thiamine phosphate phosphatase